MILDKHINSTQNVEEVAYKVCEELNVPVTKTTLNIDLRTKQNSNLHLPFFVNNHQLPELYSVSDLRYLLSE